MRPAHGCPRMRRLVMGRGNYLAGGMLVLLFFAGCPEAGGWAIWGVPLPPPWAVLWGTFTFAKTLGAVKDIVSVSFCPCIPSLIAQKTSDSCRLLAPSACTSTVRHSFKAQNAHACLRAEACVNTSRFNKIPFSLLNLLYAPPSRSPRYDSARFTGN